MAAAVVDAFDATDVQQRLMAAVTDGRYRIIGFGGGVRGTKTWGSLSVLIVLCRAFPGSRWCVVRKDLQRLRQTTIPSFDKLRQRTGGFVSRVDGFMEAKCANGSVILFRGENIDKDPTLERFHGYEVNGFLLEEADELDERTLHKCIERAGAWVLPSGAQPQPLILCTFNPNAQWPKRTFYDPWRDGTLQAPYAFIPSTIADNPHAPDSYKESLKLLPPEEYKRFVEGDWSTLSGRFYLSLDRRVHLIPRERLPQRLPDWWEYWGSYDWGFDHWAVFIAWCRDGDGNTFALDSCWMRREQDDDMARTILATMPAACVHEVYAGHDCWGRYQARGASGIETAQVFADMGITLVKADIDLVNGARAVRRALHVRPVLDAAGRPMLGADGEPMQRAGVYLIDTPQNAKGFDSLQAVIPDPNNVNKPKKADAQNGVGGDDFPDAFRYGLATKVLDPVEDWPTEEVRRIRAGLDSTSRREAEQWDKLTRQMARRRRA